MDTLSLIYFSEAAKDLNFTKTAQRLFISQQTLSNHIARLEDAYKVQLFDRKPQLMLTSAGETLLDFAREFKTQEDDMRSRLTDITEIESSRLRIGCSPHRTRVAMPYLAEEFAKKHPNVQLQFFNYHSHQLISMLLNGELDFAIAIDKSQNPLIFSAPLFSDKVYLMVSKKLLLKYYPDDFDLRIKKATDCGADLADFIDLPFLDIRPGNMVRDVFDCLNLTPHFSVTLNYAPYTETNCFENLAASIITSTTYAHLRHFVSEDILFLRVNTPPSIEIHDISFIRLQKSHLSKYGRCFLQISMDYFDRQAAEESAGFKPPSK